MRLSEKERDALNVAFRGIDGKAYLYGSRVDPAKKGGDIDVLILSKTDSPYRLSQEVSVRFQMECDEKIDVFVVDPDHVPDDQKPFLSLIRKEAILLS